MKKKVLYGWMGKGEPINTGWSIINESLMIYNIFSNRGSKKKWNAEELWPPEKYRITIERVKE